MPPCSYCGRDTELYEGGLPTCLNCADRVVDSIHGKVRSIHGQLVQKLLEATADVDAVTATHNEVMGEIPSGLPHPDGVQRIHSISKQLSIAREGLARAHSRLSDFLDRGIIPGDLK